MLGAGLLPDPYAQTLLADFSKQKFSELGSSRIPAGGCWNLMGAPDPTGRLEEGQVVVAL